MSQRPHDEQFESLAAGYFDEVLDDAGLAQLKALLHEDDRRVKRFAELSQLNQMIASEITYRQQAEKFGLNLTSDDHASTGALAELASLYEVGLQDPMNFAVWREQQANQARADRMRFWRNRAMLGGAIAALIMVAGVLAIALTGGEDPVTPIAGQVTDDQPADSNEIVERKRHAVATITATRNAKWFSHTAGGASALPVLGTQLHPNQRLTLTAGFAEITTHDGAIAILEAPATVELIDNNNALRIHTGKLVGICETDSSKGFLVRTPHADVIDLGTRFGVDVRRGLGTEVHVAKGEVVVESRATGNAGPARQHLAINEAARIDAINQKLALIQPDLDQFAPALRTFRLHSSGFALAEGDIDPNWHIVADANGKLDQLIPMAVQFGKRQGNHYPASGNDPAIAQWLVEPTGHRIYGIPARNDLDRSRLTLQSQLTLDESIDLEQAVIYFQFASRGYDSIRINGQAVEALPSSRPINRDWKAYYRVELPIDQTHLRYGQNEIEIDLVDPEVATQAPRTVYFYAEVRPAATGELKPFGGTEP